MLHRLVITAGILGAIIFLCVPVLVFARDAADVELASAPVLRAAAVSGTAPRMAPISSMKVLPGTTADQAIQATDPDGDALSFSKEAGPGYMTVTTVDAGAGTATGSIHLAPPADAVIGHIAASVIASDGVLQDEKSFTIYAENNVPTLDQPETMTVEPLHQADQTLHASDPDQDPLTFSLVEGPGFVFVKTTGPGTGNVRLTPVKADSGIYQVSVSVSDGLASHARSFAVTVLPGSIPIMGELHDMTVSPGQVLTQGVEGGDLDGGPIWFSKVEGPSFMSVTGRGAVGQAYGYIRVAPTLTDEPTDEGGDYDYPATVSLSDGRFSVSRSFTIHVHFPGSHPPVLMQPADFHVHEGSIGYAYLTYSDPDPEPLGVSVIEGPPFLFLHFDSPTTTLLMAGPGYDDAGIYPITVRVTDSRGLYDEKSLQLIVEDAPSYPWLTQPKDMLVFAGRTAEQDLHASDRDGLPLTFYKVVGPDYVTVETVNPGAGLGRIRVAPHTADIGRDSVQVGVWNGGRGDNKCFTVEVADPARLALMHVDDPCVPPVDSLEVRILAADPEGDRLTFTQSGLPSFGTFTDHEDGTASLVLWTRRQPPGVTFMTVNVTDGQSTVSEMFAITVGHCGGAVFAGGDPENRFPISDPGGPYAAYQGDPIAFDGTGSSDPEGHTLGYAWNFGDGAVGSGPNQVHAYDRTGVFQVELVASDGLAVDRASTTATITGALAARALVPDGRTKVRLDVGDAPLRVWLEPGGGFEIAGIDVGTLALEYDGAGNSRSIHGAAQSTPAADHDGNGAREITVSFEKSDLRSLFSDVASPAEITATLFGRTLTGAPFRAALPLTVIPGRGRTSAALYPNPLNPDATLSFTLREPGPVHVTLFDLQGRLVHTLMDERSVAAGYHELRIEAKDAAGRKLASGVYFYRIETAGDVTTGRFAILK